MSQEVWQIWVMKYNESRIGLRHIVSVFFSHSVCYSDLRREYNTNHQMGFVEIKEQVQCFSVSPEYLEESTLT